MVEPLAECTGSWVQFLPGQKDISSSHAGQTVLSDPDQALDLL